jgi:hypothetical protein
MRRILISHGVARTPEKRGESSVVRLPLDEALDFCAERETPFENFLVRSALQRPLDKLIIIYAEKSCAAGLEESGILDIDKISRLLTSSCFILLLVILFWLIFLSRFRPYIGSAFDCPAVPAVLSNPCCSYSFSR